MNKQERENAEKVMLALQDWIVAVVREAASGYSPEEVRHSARAEKYREAFLDAMQETEQ